MELLAKKIMVPLSENDLESQNIDATSTSSKARGLMHMSDEKQKTDLDSEVEAVASKLEEAQIRNRKLKIIAKNLEAIVKLEEENAKLTKENDAASRRKF